jgi:flagellar hook-basal body complex protein FliE
MNVPISRAASAYANQSKLLEGIAPSAAEESGSSASASFSKTLGDALEGAIATGYASEQVKLQALTGRVELSDLVTAVAEAELTLNTVVAVRDRVIAAYQDILRMPI